MVRLTPKALLLALLLAAFALAIPQPAAAGTETILHSFTGQPDGASPTSGLTADSAGNLYGVTSEGGTYNFGTVYQLTPPATAGGTWAYQIIYNFTGGNDGANPTTDLLLDSHGALFGATSQGGGTTCSCGVVFKLNPPTTAGGAWSQKAIYHFQGGTDGASPLYGSMLRDSTGAIYLTTGYGGIFGYGRALKLTSGAAGNWTESALLDFNATLNANPRNGMVFDSKGNLLGTAPGNADLFKLSAPTPQYPYWNDSVVGYGDSYGDLTIDKYNVLYLSYPNGNGTAYGDIATLAPTATGVWKQTVLYTFTGGSDGGYPLSGLTRDAKNNVLYGTAALGGPGCSSYYAGCGVVYKLTKTGSTWSYSTVYSFQGGNDGWNPSAQRLLLDASGNLYGVTPLGGSTLNNGNGFGTVYKVTQ